MAIHSLETGHYENFPVASMLCPARLRPAIGAIYAFARTADDLADEGDTPAAQRLDNLRAYRQDLLAVVQQSRPSERWPQVFTPLAHVLHAFNLPPALMLDLLSAFEQDITQHRYADRAELLEYCRRSANPIGRLLLHLYGVTDNASHMQSDAICSALQLANFWQDLSIDTARRRLYIPLADCDKAHAHVDYLMAGADSPAARVLVQEMVQWTRALMQQGAGLAQTLHEQAGWRIGLELKLVIQGGLRILEKIEHSHFNSFHKRPRLGIQDIPLMLWRSWRMRPPQPRPGPVEGTA